MTWRRVISGLFLWALAVLTAAPAAAAARSTLMPAAPARLAGRAPMLALDQAGPRMVAVGAYGLVMLSDDYGETWRQARAVPTQAMLTDVTFLNARDGFAVGQDGLIIETGDGGESWALRYVDLARGLPLLTVHFLDARHGFAMGALGFVLETKDGGLSWSERLLRRFDYADLNLNKIVERDGVLYVASQFGVVYRSVNAGASFEPVQSPTQADFWTALVVPGGKLVFAGAKGALWRARADLTGWESIDTGSKSGVAALALTLDGRLAAAGPEDYFAIGSKDGDRLAGPDGLKARPRAPAALLAGPRGFLVYAGTDGLALTPDGAAD